MEKSRMTTRQARAMALRTLLRKTEVGPGNAFDFQANRFINDRERLKILGEYDKIRFQLSRRLEKTEQAVADEYRG